MCFPIKPEQTLSLPIVYLGSLLPLTAAVPQEDIFFVSNSNRVFPALVF